MMKRAKLADSDAPFSYISMIDIVFLILIFFMCATRFKQIEQKLDAFLPPDIGQEKTTRIVDPEELTIFIRDDARMRKSTDFNIRAGREATYYLASRDASPVTDMTVLMPTLMRLAENPERKVLIAPYDEKDGKDQLVPFFNVIRVVDACKAAGFRHIRFQAPAVMTTN